MKKYDNSFNDNYFQLFAYQAIQRHLNEPKVKHIFRFAHSTSPDLVHTHHTIYHIQLHVLEYSFSQILVYHKFWIPCCLTIP